ncbi:MAG: metallophosphoesterase [Planctomycetes bacterium]|nr:metallophosphoesterase [Planctomycetota bacterium]
MRRSASEYEQAKSIIKRMRLNKEQAKDVARRAYESDLKNGRPDIALKCAKEYDLSDAYLTRAATVLFMELINRRNYPKALEIARSYNLAHGGKQAQRALAKAGALKDAEAQGVIDEIGGLARAASSARLEVSQADQAIDLIHKAKLIRDGDPHVKGRAVFLPEGPGDVWLAGDLHGNVNNLKRLAQLADLSNNPQRTLVLQEIVHARLITADNRDLSFVAIMEAIKLMVAHPGQVYYMLGNHDLALNLRRELVKGGKFLNRYLFRGMAYMYRGRYEDVLEAYREFIGDMPAAIFSPNGVFMSHSTPKRAFIPTLSRSYLSETAAEQPFNKLKPIVALVNGREYTDEAAEEFADRLECDVMLCGHTPTSHGFTVKNKRHLIVDSQHPKARYVAFDKQQRYETSEALAEELNTLYPDSAEREIEGELL